MSWKHIFAKKDLEQLLAEMAGEHRLHRVLGPVSLTALGIGCIIGAGIFVMTGRAAAEDAGPAVVVSFAIAGLGCAFAALCYAEFAAMAPVAGSAYTYAYTTLGEVFAWIIGWDLILEYAMGCATVASAWAKYLNAFLLAISGNKLSIPPQVLSDPLTPVEGFDGTPWFNLPSVLIMILVTTVLVIGIRESARSNAVLVLVKLTVVLFVLGLGWFYVNPSNWNTIPYSDRVLTEETKIAAQGKEDFAAMAAAREVAKMKGKSKQELQESAAELKSQWSRELAPLKLDSLRKQLAANYRLEFFQAEAERLQKSGKISPDQARESVVAVEKKVRDNLPKTEAEKSVVSRLMPAIHEAGASKAAQSWGVLGLLGLNQWLLPIDDAMRSPFAPYGFSGIMLGAAIVFFAFIGFDSISTHAEEAKKPQRDVPIGILTSLTVCTVLYMAVALVITGMIPYPSIDTHAPIATAFSQKNAPGAAAIIALGGLAGMTSVLLVLFLSQARIFMAMSRDGLLPQVFGTVHPKFRTPHIATIVTGIAICLASAFTPIKKLEEMVNIGTLLAFVMVCAAVLMLRIQRPGVKRPFRCPLIWIVAPLGMIVNFSITLFLPLDTWLRLLVWLAIGMMIYFLYSRRHSHLTLHLLREIKTPLVAEEE
ncbi:MAG: amino acid permease [Pirellulales bacterium]|nr:amino acid permease [Pirellulales bacterium]